jgi:hypothetical protein
MGAPFGSSNMGRRLKLHSATASGIWQTLAARGVRRSPQVSALVWCRFYQPRAPANSPQLLRAGASGRLGVQRWSRSAGFCQRGWSPACSSKRATRCSRRPEWGAAALPPLKTVSIAPASLVCLGVRTDTTAPPGAGLALLHPRNCGANEATCTARSRPRAS